MRDGRGSSVSLVHGSRSLRLCGGATYTDCRTWGHARVANASQSHSSVFFVFYSAAPSLLTSLFYKIEYLIPTVLRRPRVAPQSRDRSQPPPPHTSLHLVARCIIPLPRGKGRGEGEGEGEGRWSAGKQQTRPRLFVE